MIARLSTFVRPLLAACAVAAVSATLRAEYAESDQRTIGTVTPAPDAWLDSIAEALSRHYRTDGTWTLTLVRPYEPPADAQIEVTEMPTRPSSQMMVRLQVNASDGTSSAATVFVRAQLWCDAWYAREPLSRGSSLEPQLIELRRVDVLREHDLVTGDAELADLMMSRSLPVGRYLTWRDVVRRPLVQRGQMIEVAAVDGTLSISMKALALEDGLAGELVRVRNTESRREFAAVVVAPGQAEVRF